MTAQEQVIHAYEDARQDVYHYLLRLGLNPSQAQEAAQEVFLRLLEALRKGKTIDNLRAWLFRVAHNLGLSLRTKRNYWQTLDIEFASTVPDARPDPEADAIARQRLDQVSRALSGLSPQQRRCLYLRAEGLRYQEIAVVMGVRISTVGRFLSRAIVRLRREVNEQRKVK